MDERRLAEFIGSKSGTPVDVRSVRRVALRPTRAIFDVDTTSGRFAVHMKVDGSTGPAPDTEFALMNSLNRSSSTHRHKNWCLYFAMGCCNCARSGFRKRIVSL